MHVSTVKLFVQRITIWVVVVVAATSALLPISVSAETLNTLTEDSTTTNTQLQEASPSIEAFENTDTTPPQALEVETTVTAHTAAPEELAVGDEPEASQTTTEAALYNDIESSAVSGDATGTQNTTVEDIETGSASAIATIVNTLQSSINLHEGAQPIIFIYDVEGDVTGNLVIDPSVLAADNPKQTDALEGGTPLTSNVEVSINNDIDVTAASGNATASTNTTAGDVSTGPAQAVANVINLINSAINASQSFIGIINIFGNLTGDILLPEQFVNSVLTAYASPETMNGEQESFVIQDVNATVSNNVTATAVSGSATATNNTNVGTTLTGDAVTNVTILNLTGSSVIGSNALLVFVNVMGNWVGLIFNAPAGSTSAALGGSGTSNLQSAPSGINSTVNMAINNDINASAASGNALATSNTTAGNVSSGDSYAGVNLLNILNSQISLTDWFGILFINVFGNWYGDVAVLEDTPPATGGSGGGNNKPKPKPSSSASSSSNVLDFVPFSGSSSPISTAATLFAGATLSAETDKEDEREPEVPRDTIENSAANPLEIAQEEQAESQNWYVWVLGTVFLLLALLVAGRYFFMNRRV